MSDRKARRMPAHTERLAVLDRAFDALDHETPSFVYGYGCGQKRSDDCLDDVDALNAGY